MRHLAAVGRIKTQWVLIYFPCIPFLSLSIPQSVFDSVLHTCTGEHANPQLGLLKNPATKIKTKLWVSIIVVTSIEPHERILTDKLRLLQNQHFAKVL